MGCSGSAEEEAEQEKVCIVATIRQQRKLPEVKVKRAKAAERKDPNKIVWEGKSNTHA